MGLDIFVFYSEAELFFAKVELDTISIIPNLDFRKGHEMYISLAESRAKGFVRWADAHKRERVGDTRTGAGADRDIAAPDLDQGRTTPPQAPGSFIASCPGRFQGDRDRLPPRLYYRSAPHMASLARR